LESSTITSEPGAVDTSAPGAKGLKPDALGYISNLVIAVASTAPAYSLAATLGFIVAVVGLGSPIVAVRAPARPRSRPASAGRDQDDLEGARAVHALDAG